MGGQSRGGGGDRGRRACGASGAVNGLRPGPCRAFAAGVHGSAPKARARSRPRPQAVHDAAPQARPRSRPQAGHGHGPALGRRRIRTALLARVGLMISVLAAVEPSGLRRCSLRSQPRLQLQALQLVSTTTASGRRSSDPPLCPAHTVKPMACCMGQALTSATWFSVNAGRAPRSLGWLCWLPAWRVTMQGKRCG